MRGSFLDNTLSTQGIVERAVDQETVKYRVEIRSADFAIDPARVIFNLAYGHDSEVKWFKLRTHKRGRLTFIVFACQVADDVEIASTRVVLEAIIETRLDAPHGG